MSWKWVCVVIHIVGILGFDPNALHENLAATLFLSRMSEGRHLNEESVMVEAMRDSEPVATQVADALVFRKMQRNQFDKILTLLEKSADLVKVWLTDKGNKREDFGKYGNQYLADLAHLVSG